MSKALEISASERMLLLVQEHPLLLAVTLEGPEDWRGLGGILQTSGLDAVEIMLRSPYAWDGLEQLQQNWPKLKLGIGTVLKKQDLQKAADLGLDFAVSPGTHLDLVDTARELNLPYLPGAMTPSELMLLASRSFRAVKFFPGVPLGLSYLQSMAAPFPELRFCISGGLNSGNYQQFLELPQVLSLSGSWALPQNLSDGGACVQALPKIRQLQEEFHKAMRLKKSSSPSDHGDLAF